jgi:hypothetical protein
MAIIVQTKIILEKKTWKRLKHTYPSRNRSLEALEEKTLNQRCLPVTPTNSTTQSVWIPLLQLQHGCWDPWRHLVWMPDSLNSESWNGDETSISRMHGRIPFWILEFSTVAAGRCFCIATRVRKVFPIAGVGKFSSPVLLNHPVL